MPTYEYICQACLAHYEERRTFAKADEPSACPECASPRVQRMVSTFYAFSPGSSLSIGGGCACSNGGTCGCSATPAHNHN